MAKLATPAAATAAESIAATDMERLLTQLPFWSSLTEHEKETIRRSVFTRHYEKGAFIHSSDNECLGMLFVLSGEIRTYLLSEEGREVTLFRPHPPFDAVRIHLRPSLRWIQILSGRNTRVADSAERISLRRPVNKSFCYLPSRNLHIF